MAYTPDSCGSLQFCSPDETCFVQEHWDIVKYYQTGCQRKHLCLQPNGATQVGKRSTFCYRCCDENLCNSRCDDDLNTSQTTTDHSNSISLPTIAPPEMTSQPPEVCDDLPECTNMNLTAICADRQTAKTLCPRTCGLCPSDCGDRPGLCVYLNETISLCSNLNLTEPVGCLAVCDSCVTGVPGTASTITNCDTAPRLLRGDNKGTDFYLATFYLAKFHNYPHFQNPYLSILSDDDEGTCTITYGNTSDTHSLVRGRNIIPVQQELVLTDPGLAVLSQPREVITEALHLHCSHTVDVIGVQKRDVSGQTSVNEAFLAFSVQQCSTSFVIASYPYSTYEYNVIAVISPTGSDVTFYNNEITTAPFNGTKTFNVSLQSNGVFHLSSLDNLSGTRVTSSSPVCVLSSKYCLSDRKGICSMLIQSVPPVVYLETNFVVPVLMPNYSMSITIVAAHDNTSVTMIRTNQNSTSVLSPVREVVVLNRGMYLTKQPGVMTDLTVTATKGIVVSQVGYGNVPLCIPVSAVTQYKDMYQFDSLTAKDNYITIIIENMHNTSSMLESLVLDHSSLSGSVLSYNTSLRCSEYSIFTVAVSDGPHVIRHLRSIPFGLVVHGIQYGYPAGMKFMLSP